MRCGSCGSENPDGAVFCNMCAKPLELASPETITTERSWTKKFWFSTYTVYPERERSFIVIETRSPVFASYRQVQRYSKTLWYGINLFALSLFIVFGFMFSLAASNPLGCFMTVFWFGGTVLGFWFFAWITLLPPK